MKELIRYSQFTSMQLRRCCLVSYFCSIWFHTQMILRLSLFFIPFWLASCTGSPAVPITQYDLLTPLSWPLPQKGKIPLFTLATVTAAPWMDTSAMPYRLAYTNLQAIHLYAYHRWSSLPSKLFQQRLEQRLIEAGGTLQRPSDGTSTLTTLPLLRIELENFTQIFTSPTKSRASVHLLASLFQHRTLLTQRRFSHTAAAPTPDAAGGAQAMAKASEAVIDEILTWVQASLSS